MELKTQLSDMLKRAIKENDTDTKRVVRSILSSIKNSEIEKMGDLTPSEMIAIIQKELKVRYESIEGANLNNRADLVQEYEKEIAIINQFLPKQLNETELRNLIVAAISDLNAKGIADMGRVMKELLPRIAGRAPGNQVSTLVKEILSA